MGAGKGRMVSREGRKAVGLEKYIPCLHKLLGTLLFDQLNYSSFYLGVAIYLWNLSLKF